jgi:hypothetical protein
LTTTSRVTDRSVEADIAQLGSLDLQALRQLWVAQLGSPPKHRSLELLRRRLAYELQVRAYGGLKPVVRNRLRQLYKSFKASPSFTPLRHRDLKAGSVLSRGWGGVVHSVTVLEGGFEYRGDKYSSLSEIASKIAGAKWSGPRFFRLTEP